MAADFPKPVLFGGREFEVFAGSQDPAMTMRLAHDTAAALLARVRASDDPAVVERIITYTDEHGIDAIAELWALAGSHTLPGALWRIHLLRAMIRRAPDEAAFLFRAGVESLATIDPVVAGAPSPAGPDEIAELADTILRGVFAGDLAHALERASAFCRVQAAGCLAVADDQDAASPDRARELTARAARLTDYGEALAACARLARDGALD